MVSPITTTVSAVASTLANMNQQQVAPAQSVQASAAATAEVKRTIDKKSRNESGTGKQTGEKKALHMDEARVESSYTPSRLVKHKTNNKNPENKDQEKEEQIPSVDTIA